MPVRNTAAKRAAAKKKGRRPVRPPQERSWGWIAGFVVLVVIAAGGVTYAALNQGSGNPTDPANINIAGVQTYENLGRQHTQGQVNYERQPPVGGSHNPVWLDCMGTVYNKPVPNENAVHSLEHGAVWITYQPDLPEKQRQALAQRVQGQPYTLMSPYPGQQSPIVLSAWGHQLQLQSADDPRIDQFLSAYVQGPQTPEPGATCTSGRMQ